MGGVLVLSGSLNGKPKYYSLGGDSGGFSYDVKSTIVEKRDSAGNLQGFYIYPPVYTRTSVYYKTFTWSSREDSVNYKIVQGGDQGGRVNVETGNIFYGGAGDDLLVGVVKPENYNGIYIGALLSGGEGNDTILGSSYADTLAGGSGNNLLMGGYGGDTYIIDSSSGNDIITDFTTPFYADSFENPAAWYGLDQGDRDIDVVALPGVSISATSASAGGRFWLKVSTTALSVQTSIVGRPRIWRRPHAGLPVLVSAP